MTNNDSLRSLRYTFNLSDSKMIKIFSLAEVKVTREQVSSWLKQEDHPDYISLKGSEFASFLNGFIIKKRGCQEGKPIPVPEKWMTNNLVLKKVKIALKLTSDDIKKLLDSTGLEVSDHELSALFRKPDHKNYRSCQDQFLRSFLKGLQLKHRPDEKKRFKKTMDDFKPGDKVDLTILRETDLGFVAQINNGPYEGLLYHDEIFQILEPDQIIDGFIKKIRSYDEIDLILQPAGNLGAKELGEQIIETIKEQDGFIPINAKSPAEEIYNMFGVSKKKFKIALGALYKKKLITFNKSGTELVD